jgi:NAD(P)-dependent dehydrogenase (short-subunit alcohol dehydrogenase family)
MTDLTGRTALVTGGSRGIGRAIVSRFLDAGAAVVTCGRNEPDNLPAGAVFVACDVRDPDQVESLFTTAVDKLGRLDVLVNNAGGSPPADAATASPRFSTAIVTLNLLAPLFCAQRANAVMQDQDEGGVIVSVSSLSGLRPSPGTAAYGAAKAGLINLTQSLAQEWAPKVRVNCVTAGLVLTPDSAAHYGDEQRLARVAGTVPLGRFGTPDDVAAACLWLASPDAAFVTGSNLVLHGGGERPPFLDA